MALKFSFQIFARAFDLVFTFSSLSRQCRYKRGHNCEKYSVFHSQPSRSDLNCSFSSLSTPSACAQLESHCPPLHLLHLLSSSNFLDLSLIPALPSSPLPPPPSHVHLLHRNVCAARLFSSEKKVNVIVNEQHLTTI